jgi:hypothetical protein
MDMDAMDDLDELDRFLAPFRRLRDPDTLLDEPDNARPPDNYASAVVTSLFIRLFVGVVNNPFTLLYSTYQLYILSQRYVTFQARRRHGYNSYMCGRAALGARAIRITRRI